MPDRDILILMSTHNGEHHVAEQMCSLQAQTVAHRMHVLIRDDGSTDSTVALVTSLSPEPLTVEVVEGVNLGARDSFAALMGMAPGDYRIIMLCDQDDVWLPDKVEIATEAIVGARQDTPVLYCGRSTLTDDCLTPRGLTNDAPQGPSLHHAIFQNIAPGHTMALNQSLLRLARETMNAQAVMHDWWLYCLAAGLGDVVFDPVPHALYRLHASNEIGYAATAIQRLASRIRRLGHEDRSITTRQARALMTSVGAHLSLKDRRMLAAFLDQGSLASRLRFLRRYGMPAQATRLPLTSTLLYTLGRYRDPAGGGA